MERKEVNYEEACASLKINGKCYIYTVASDLTVGFLINNDVEIHKQHIISFSLPSARPK